MPKADLLLAIDHGTQSARAIVFDLEGNPVARSKVPIQPYVSTQPGWAEQDGEVYWRAVCDACQALWQEPGDLRARVCAVALTTQRGTILALDEHGTPLRPAITWLDQREATQLPPMGGVWPVLFSAIGMGATMDYFRRQAECNWIAGHEAELWSRTRKVALLSGFLTLRLTDRFADSVGCAVGYLPFNYKKLAWCGAREWQWRALAVRPDQLPTLHKPGERIGEISASAAAATGIPAGLPLFAAAADKACEVLGSGCLEPNVGCISYGTTATINVANRRYVEPVPLLPPYPAAVPDAYNTEVQIFRGFWMVEWFKGQFGFEEVARARDAGHAPERLFDEMIRDIPAGSMGLTLQPYWTPGIRLPGREAKGAIIGFGDVHTRAHVYRAILEGLAYGLHEGAERVQKRTGVPIERLRISGGGSQSDEALQITADVFNLPAERPHTFETSALGAAMAAAVGSGLYADFPTAVARMTRVGRTFEPRPDAARTYDALYRRVYQHMYGRLRPLYQAIRDVTGYPA